MAKLVDVTSQYELVKIIASELATVELFNLARTSKTLWKSLDPLSLHFNSVKSLTLCDGHVVARRLAAHAAEMKRREVEEAYRSDHDYIDGIEALTCLGSESLPCVKCGVNVCEVSVSNLRDPLRAAPSKD